MSAIQWIDCNDASLRMLLVADEDSAELRMGTAHVDRCEYCQNRLAQLVADEGDWAETRAMLKPEETLLIEQWPTESRGHWDFLLPPSHPELLGRIGRFDVESEIGIGGFGIVFKAFDSELNRTVAIKVLAPHLATNGSARQRFAREARAVAAIAHENVVAIHNVESEHPLPFLVMQYVSGRSLQAKVDARGPLEVDDILRIGLQTAAGLSAAHAQGVVHRDIKPANILLENDLDRVLLTDFGLARAADDASLTQSGVVAGTPHYMSPEQASGEHIGPESDLFSLGSVLYFMATGRPPFRAEKAMGVLHRICKHRHRNVREVNPKVPVSLARVIDRLLAKKPSRRLASAEEVKRELERILVECQNPSRPNSGRGRLIGTATVLIACLSIGWATKQYWQTSSDGVQRQKASFDSADLETQMPTGVDAVDGIREIERAIEALEAPHKYQHYDGWQKEWHSIVEQITRVEKWFAGPPGVSDSRMKGSGK